LPASVRRDADARASASVMVFLVFVVWVALIVYACAPAYVFTGARYVFWVVPHTRERGKRNVLCSSQAGTYDVRTHRYVT
jgi:hypothetical protein